MYKQPLWIHLPSKITTNILLRLPTRTILSCKCVCKQWLQLISTPEFAKSHLSVSVPGLVMQQTYMMCKIFEFEDVLELQHHNLHYNQVMEFSPSSSISSPNDNIWISGSVNGLLFLSDWSQDLDTFYICNPITREYIPLHKPQTDSKHPNKLSQYGFGVSLNTGQYKVVRNVHKCTHDPNAQPCSRIQNYECLVYTVGTESWRSITPGAPFGHYHLLYSVFLNGNLHGLVQDYCDTTNMLISCFDLETEVFHPFPPPPPSIELCSFGSLGVLDDCLCFCDNSSLEGDVVIWVMKEYGVEESWTKLFVVVGTSGFIGLEYEAVYPIKVFKDGDILLQYQWLRLFYYSSKTNTCHNLDFTVPYHGYIGLSLHKSSFLSLKSLGWENVKSFSYMVSWKGRRVRSSSSSSSSAMLRNGRGHST